MKGAETMKEDTFSHHRRVFGGAVTSQVRRGVLTAACGVSAGVPWGSVRRGVTEAEESPADTPVEVECRGHCVLSW